jgi:hypothetical protein
MTQDCALKSSSNPKRSEPLAPVTTLLTGKQLECVRRCAQGISLRFEAWEIIEPLIAGGYIKQGVAGVVTVTAKGHEYLRTHPES